MFKSISLAFLLSGKLAFCFDKNGLGEAAETGGHMDGWTDRFGLGLGFACRGAHGLVSRSCERSWFGGDCWVKGPHVAVLSLIPLS